MDTLPPVRSRADVPSLRQGSDGAALGEFLRRARERRGLTLQQIANETKIPQRHLDALEHGNLSVVPRGIYQRAEIRAFARTVGVDQQLALAQLERALQASNTSQAAPPVSRPPGDRLRWRAVGLIGITILTAAVSAVAVWSWTPAQLREARAAAAPRDTAHDVVLPSHQTPAVIVDPVARDVVDREAPPAGDVEGRLVVTSEPAGARVTINGVGWGVTPITIDHLPLGDKRIRVTLEGFASAERVVPLAADRPAREVHVPLHVRQ